MEDFICDFLNNNLPTLEFGEHDSLSDTFCVGRRPRPSAFLFFSTKQY